MIWKLKTQTTGVQVNLLWNSTQIHVFLTCISYLTKSIQTHRISTNYTLKLGDEVVKVVVRKIIIAMVAVITRLGTLKTKLEFEKSTERCCTLL